MQFILKSNRHSEFLYTVSDLFILLLSAIFAFLIKYGRLEINQTFINFFLVYLISWLLTSFLTKNYKAGKSGNYFSMIWPFVKTDIILIASISFFVYIFGLQAYPRLMFAGPVIIYAVIEISAISLYYMFRKPKLSDEVDLNILRAPTLHEYEENNVRQLEVLTESQYKISNGRNVNSGSISSKLEKVYLRHNPEIFDFINSSLVLKDIDYFNSEVLSSGNPYNIRVLPSDSFNFLLNLHEVNDFRRINEYFIMANQKLNAGGVFISNFESYENRRKRFYRKYPHYIASFISIFDFIWKRIFPKMSYLKKIYFAITKGRNRALSKAEVLGRLYYCGFEIIALKEIENHIFFIAKKVKAPLKDKHPSYSLLFKMKRSGKNGLPIYVYKFRTMYPYSEYLQSFITSFNGYAENGKIKDDFRVTDWGRFFRKYWLDELPQLINVLKGEMSLVGIRPLSARFLKEYPADLLKMRLKFKPGCIPPYVALRMQAVKEYIESERIYLNEKLKHPLYTDFKYGIQAIYNILTNKIRSA